MIFQSSSPMDDILRRIYSLINKKEYTTTDALSNQNIWKPDVVYGQTSRMKIIEDWRKLRPHRQIGSIEAAKR